MLARECLHRASGQAIVTLGRKDIYLGKYDSAASRREYDRVVAEWLAAGRPTFKVPAPGTEGVAIAQILAAFLRHAKEYYRASDEADGFKFAMGPMKRLYSRLPAEDFTLSKLKAVREKMVKAGWSRNYIVKQVGRIRMIFKWADHDE